jgi:hypothetical protein
MQHTNANRSSNRAPNLRAGSQERRSTPRIETPFPAIARGLDVDARAFEEHTVLDNLSSGGLYLRLVQRVPLGMRLFVLIRLSVDLNATCIALHGMVLRSEPRPGGVFGTAIRCIHHRFIYPAAYSITYRSWAGCHIQRDIPDRR